MILGFIISVIAFLITSFFDFVIGLLPTVTIPSVVFPESVRSFFSAAQYFLPMTTVVWAFGAVMLLTFIRLAVAVLRFVKSFIPGISGGG